MSNEKDILRETLGVDAVARLQALGNAALIEFVTDAVSLLEPEGALVCTDDPEDIALVRAMAVESGEERALSMDGHTLHFDGYYDQARDREQTRYLVPPDMDLGEKINALERDQGLAEVRGLLKGAMKGKQMLVRFFCLGPVKSDFSIPCVQVTDSYYVAHSEDLLYRSGYEQFKALGDCGEFFRFMHSSGRMEGGVSVDRDKKRIYMDVATDTVYSVHTQYAGNTVGLKKLALRLAIRKASREGWLAEHMFLMGVHGPEERVTYFAGAFPSACGKTSTAMLEGQTIVGDDLAYLKKRAGEIRSVNVEQGIFGIIRDVNAKDDPVIWDALTHPGEVIFSNVLVADGVPYWLGDGREHPGKGVNHSGEWYRGKKDADGHDVTLANKNARYTLRMSELANCDPAYNDPEGVPLAGIVYGGRDSDTCVPVEQAFDWAHGVICKGASLESETTAATLGREGVRRFDLMSILDFLSIPLGQYIDMHLNFVTGVERPPMVFSVNYFLKGTDGSYLNSIADKRVWLQWAELRIRGDVDVLTAPTGYLPRHEDLQRLFREYLSQEFSEEQYVEQFSIRIPKHLEKIARIEAVYRAETAAVSDTVFVQLNAQRARLEEARSKYGDIVSPFDL